MADKDRPLSPEEKDKATAEAERARAEAGRAVVESRKLAAEAGEAEAKAEAAVIHLAGVKRVEAKVLAGDEFYRVYRFNDAVSATSARSCMAQLAHWMRVDPECPIEIAFCSPGGSVIDGMALFDFIQQVRRAGHVVTTSALGYAASMAGILLQAGDKRVMAKESWLLIHEVSFGASGSMGDIEDVVEWVKRVQERVLDIFAARSNLSKATLKRRWRRKDWWISSDEALKFGLVDEVR